MKKSVTNFTSFHRNIKVRIIESFLSQFVGSMIFPFMAIYLARNFGIEVTGLLLFINVFVGILVTFISGYISDQHGRKMIILSSETIRLIAFLIMMYCNSPWFNSPLITFLMMTVNTICWALSGPVNQAMLIDVSTNANRKTMFSILYWANNLSISIGGIIGAFLFTSYLFELFIILSIITGSIVFLIAFFIEESYYPKSITLSPIQHISNLFKSYKVVLMDRIFILFTAASVLVLSLEYQLVNYIGIRLSNTPSHSFLEWEITGVMALGILRAENTILVVIMVLFINKVSKRYQDKNILIFSSLIFTIGFGVLSYSVNIWTLFFMMLLLTTGEVLKVPVEQSYMASLPPSNARSSYMSFIGLKYNLAMLIASLTVFFSETLSPIMISIIITLFGLVGTLIYGMIIPKLEQRKVQE